MNNLVMDGCSFYKAIHYYITMQQQKNYIQQAISRAIFHKQTAALRIDSSFCNCFCFKQKMKSDKTSG